MSTTKQKLKTFFKARESSESAVELLQKFIIPFSRGMRRVSVDDVLAAFFAIDDRQFVYAKALRDFKMPGKFYIAGNRPVLGAGPRTIKEGQTLLLVPDRREGTMRIEAVIEKRECNFLLERFEIETIKEWIDVIS